MEPAVSTLSDMLGEFAVQRQQFAFHVMQCALQVFVGAAISEGGNRADDPTVGPSQWRGIDSNGNQSAVSVGEASFARYDAFPLQGAG
jgi:hypothetical protein